MERLAEKILEQAGQLSEGTPIAAKSLLHLGSREAVDQALSRLVRRGRLLRIGRGLYLCPVQSRYGVHAPSPEKVVPAIARERGETVASNGVAAANTLGLTTQAPMRTIYLTSGPSRTLKLGAQTVELKHAPPWQLVMPNRPGGEAIRALAWLGPAKATEALRRIRRALSDQAWQELTSARPLLPSWMAQAISEMM